MWTVVAYVLNIYLDVNYAVSFISDTFIHIRNHPKLRPAVLKYLNCTISNLIAWFSLHLLVIVTSSLSLSLFRLASIENGESILQMVRLPENG